MSPDPEAARAGDGALLEWPPLPRADLVGRTPVRPSASCTEPRGAAPAPANPTRPQARPNPHPPKWTWSSNRWPQAGRRARRSSIHGIRSSDRAAPTALRPPVRHLGELAPCRRSAVGPRTLAESTSHREARPHEHRAHEHRDRRPARQEHSTLRRPRRYRAARAGARPEQSNAAHRTKRL